MRVIFDAGPQRWKIWFVLVLSLLGGAMLVWMGGYVLQSYGLDPREGGVLKPLAIRVLFGIGFGVSGIAIIAGILLYLQLYVMRIEEDEASDAFRVTVAGFGRPRTIQLGEVTGMGYNHGMFDAGGVSVNAPWYSLRLRGRRFGLIVDLQGDFHDQQAVERLLAGEQPPVAERKPTRTYRKHLARQRRR
ncbi:hypothetical protein [Longimicrobium sp.]|uniref:hypothetical protein n=1 Tax=Longimicrobium sp. TaxID=2029185 RepID=UPI003B3B0AFE